MEIGSSQGLSLTTIPREILILAEALSRIHGPSVIRNESNGYHIYLPSPECLKTDGRKEINSKHLTVNASRYKQTSDWVAKHGELRDDLAKDFSAICHKTNTRFRVSDLLNEKKFPTLENRGLPNISSKILCAATLKSNSLVDDGKGNMVPMDPGEVIPIIELPARHPAVVYLKDRGYDLNILYKQFRCSYCVKEQPENPEKGIYYKKLPKDFRDTPQGRIIFYAFINGVQVGWQARIIEKVESGFKYYWHPYFNKWVATEHRDEAAKKWKPIPGIEIKGEGYDILWKPSKYKTAFGMSRNETIMGVDAAVNFNKFLKMDKPVAFVVEGPLDAGRIGPGGIALLGKYYSDKQAELLSNKFKKLVFIADNDAAGKEFKIRVREVMQDKMTQVVFLDIPEQYKDIGEMSTEDVIPLIFTHLK
jgi:hypothetical protein